MGEQRERPKGVPADARWVEADKEWVAGPLKDGKKQGPFRFWREDGTLACENTYVDDVGEGPYKRFHENGEISQEGLLTHGKHDGVCLWQRSNGPTTENTISEAHGKNVWTAVQRLADGEALSLWQHHYDREGREVAFSGELAPPRPTGIPAEAEYGISEGEPSWFQGRYKVPSGTKIGLWRWWSPEGELRHIEFHHDGKCVAMTDARPVAAAAPGEVQILKTDHGTAMFDSRPRAKRGRTQGNPLIAAAKAGDQAAVDLCLAAGVGALPNTALFAAYEGLPDLARTLGARKGGPGFHDPGAAAPTRRGAIPADSLWVAGLGWVRGRFDAGTGRALGTWDRWDAPAGYTFVRHEQADFQDGQRSGFRTYDSEERVKTETSYDAQGRTIRWRKFEEGRLEKETEFAPDGAKIVRNFYESGAVHSECTIRQDRAWTQVKYENGTLKAEGAQAIDDDGDPGPMQGAWKFFERKGDLILTTGMEIPPWEDLAGQDPTYLADLVRMSKLKTWVSQVAGRVPWTELSDPDDCNHYAFGEIGNVVPWLLEGMLSGDPALAVAAYSELFNDTMHQGSIYESGAYLTPIFLRMLQEPCANREHLFEILSAYADSLRGCLEYIQSSPEEPPARWMRLMLDGFRGARGRLVELARGAPDPETRTRAVALLAQGVLGDEGWADLFGLYRAEEDIVRRAQLVLALVPLTRTPAALQALAAEFSGQRHPAVRFVLALTLVQASARAGKVVPGDAVEELVGYAQNEPAELTQVYASLTGEDAAGPLGANIAGSLANSLKDLPERIRVGGLLVGGLIQKMLVETTIDAFHYVAALLQLTQPRDAQEATSDQLRGLRRQVLEGIVELRDTWWEWVNLREVLRGYGLPTAMDAAEGRKLIREFAAGHDPWALPEEEEEDEGGDEED